MDDDAPARISGKLIVIFGPTGSGKSVLIEYIKEKYPDIIFPASYITRERRNAVENSSYVFISKDEFKARIEKGEFLEWAEYSGNYYGTSRHEVETGLRKGKILLKEAEVQGVRQIISLIPPDELVIFYIDAGSWEELERRIMARSPLTPEDLAKRHERFLDEVTFKDKASFVIQNHFGKLEEAKEAISRAIEEVQHGTRA